MTSPDFVSLHYKNTLYHPNDVTSICFFQKRLQKYCFFCTYTNICAKKCHFLLFYSLFLDFKWERANQFTIYEEIRIVDSGLKNLLYQPI